jgi:hypothetical protein
MGTEASRLGGVIIFHGWEEYKWQSMTTRKY